MSQRSISSFFTPQGRKKADPVAESQISSSPNPSLKSSQATTLRTTAPRQRQLSAVSQNDSFDESNDDVQSPISKRPLETTNDEDDSPSTIDFSDHVAKKARQSPAADKSVSLKTNGSTKANTIIRDRFAFTPLSSQVDRGSASPSASEQPLDREAELKKKRLHEKFVRVLGKPDSIADIRRRRFGDAREEDGEEGDEEDDEEDRQPVAKKGSKAAAKRGTKLTPLEQQVVDIKTKHPDTLLVVEVGYKFRFFGEDARTAAGILSIMCIPGKMKFNNDPSEAHLTKFASASIPTHRLHVHVKRLVAAGHKVGVVRQLETAALKAAGDNRNTPFTRKLTNLYTKGTYVDEVDAADDDTGASAPATGYLLCITEKMGGGTGADEKVKVGLLAVQPSTGDILYDEFIDGFMRSEIETRLLHIAPCELLILGEMSKATDKLMSYFAGSTTNILGDRIRVERVERAKNMSIEASSHVSTFYAEKVKTAKETGDDRQSQDLLDIVTGLPEQVTVCLSAMITHLEAYGLEHVFDLTKNFQSFSARSHMLLNGNTLSSLEIYTNQTDFTEKGSLFWTLNRTQTKFGRRLLRRWVGRPLLDKNRLEERISAVEELKGSSGTRTQTLKDLLKRTRYDLEKGLIRIYYGKASRPELLSILQTLLSISIAFGSDQPGYTSSIINDAMMSLPKISAHVQHYLSLFDHKAALKDDIYNFFIETEDYESITDHKMGITGVEHDLQEHLKEAAISAQKKKLEYVTVSGIDYLVEIENASLKNVPSTWVKISGTKKLSRFHTPVVIQMLKERDQRKESLAADCNRHFRELLSQIAQKYQEFRNAVQSLAILDCLVSLATVAMQPGYVKPTFTDETQIVVKQGRHPMVEQLLLDAYVPNDVNLRSSETTTVLLTGPNMGGKSSYVRQVALISIMGQIGSYVPAESAQLGLLDAVFTRMGAFDNMMTGESTFMVELSETSDIIKQATSRSLIVLDELGRGTSTHDGVAIAHAVLDHVIGDIKALTLFVTHYPILAQFEEKYPKKVVNTHMKFEEAKDGSEDITFLYQVTPGVAHRSYGLNVAKLANIPKMVLETAAVKSKELEIELKGRELSRWVSKISDQDSSIDEEFLQQLGHIA